MEGQSGTWQRVRFPVVAFLAVACWLALVVWVSDHWLERHPGYPVAPVPFRGSWLLGGWFRFDGGWYDLIARSGYYSLGPDQQSPVAFFPAYPLSMRAVGRVLGDEILAGIVITFVCGLVATVLVYRWTLDRLGPSAARTTVLLLVLFPYGWYLFGAVYADALFLVAVLAAFVLLERGHPVLAGIAGAVATAARPVALAVMVGLVAVLVERRGALRNPRALKPADAGVLLSVTGLVAWSGYLWSRFGDPLLWVKIQRAAGWDQGSGPHTWFKVTFLQRLKHLPFWLSDSLTGSTTHHPAPWTESAYTLGLILQATLLLGFLALTVVVWKRLGWGYAAYAITLLVVPLLGTKDFQGVGRYLLAAFPCFAVLAILLEPRPRLRLATFIVSGMLLTLLASAYARGYYVA
ncbi:hypothetical protein [Rhabdothermincola sp.]|uniref:hypothetical protein n=1 Tax=Rhabdothermincola sp. TaxID=2820405 RepID=UPI002FE15806